MSLKTLKEPRGIQVSTTELNSPPLRNLDNIEAACLLEAMKLSQEGGLPLEEALALFRAKLDARRARPAEVAA